MNEEEIAGRVYDAMIQDGIEPYRARYILCGAFFLSASEAEDIAENSPWARITESLKESKKAVEEFRLACAEIEEEEYVD